MPSIARKQPFSFREEFRTPEAYETPRRTNPRAGSGMYGDLAVGSGWKDPPREDDWPSVAAIQVRSGALETGNQRLIAAKALVCDPFVRVRATDHR